MQSFIFWRKWNPAHQTAYWTGLVLLITALTGMLWAWSQGLQNVVHWDVLSELTELPATIRSFTDGLLDYPVTSKTYLVAEQFVASTMQVNVLAARLVTLGVCLGLAFMLAAITRLSRMPYLIAMSLLILLVATFRLEALQLPGLLGSALGSRLPFLGVVVLFGAVSYYFHSFKPEMALPVRLGVFVAMALLGWLAFNRLAEQPAPALAFVSYAMPALLLISVGFIFWIASEIIAALVYLTSLSRTNAEPLGLNNFLFLSLLYLVNLLLVWLSNTKTISWNPVTVNPFVLFLISLVMGLWGVRQQFRQTENWPSFRDAGAFLYLGAGLITVLTLTFAFATANDPLVEALEDVITYTHLGVGVLFVAYVVVNFQPLYQQKLPVYRVLYKPLRFSLLQTRLLAAFSVVALLSVQNFFSFNQAVAGYFNNLGDLHTATGEVLVAEQYYKLALNSEFQNHKSNYALASLALNQGDKVTATHYFQQALLKQPSPQAYAGLTSVLLQDNLFFEAVKMLQKGIRTFPRNGELQNNLGYLYAKTSVADSAYYYLAAATGNTRREDVPQTNLLAFWATNPQLLSLDSLAKATEARSDEAYEANRAALKLLSGPAADSTQPSRPDWLDEPITEEGLSVGRFANLYNYAVQNRTTDTTLLAVLHQLEQSPANQDFTDDLLFARAVANYYTANKREAFEITDQLARDNTRTGPFYNRVTGLWMMEQGLNQKAAEVLEQNPDTLSIYYRALALTKAGDPLIAESSWKLAGQNDPGVRALAEALYGPQLPANDTQKAFVLLYDPSPDTTRQIALYQSMQDNNLKTLAASALVNRSLTARQMPAAKAWYERIPENAQLNPYAGSVLTLAYLRLQNALGQYDRTLAEARQTVVPSLEAQKDALLAQAYGAKRQIGQARQWYARALRQAPFNAGIVVAAADLEQKAGQIQKAYDLVLNALPLNDTEPELLKRYTLLCLDLRLTDYAEDGLSRLRTATSPTDYQAFLASYQSKRALIEKERQAFQ